MSAPSHPNHDQGWIGRYWKNIHNLCAGPLISFTRIFITKMFSAFDMKPQTSSCAENGEGGGYRNHHSIHKNVYRTIIFYVLPLIGMILWFTKAKSKPLEFLFFKRYKNWKNYRTPSSVVYVELEVMKPPPFDSASQYGYFFILDRDQKKSI